MIWNDVDYLPCGSRAIPVRPYFVDVEGDGEDFKVDEDGIVVVLLSFDEVVLTGS